MKRLLVLALMGTLMSIFFAMDDSSPASADCSASECADCVAGECMSGPMPGHCSCNSWGDPPNPGSGCVASGGVCQIVQ